MRQDNASRLVAVACLLGGGFLLTLAETAPGQHARGHWVAPAKTLGALLLIAGCYLVLVLVLAGLNRRGH
jgi:uncharacterized membrane protein YdjX (TVP38/TMEM64 family)